MAIFQIQSAFEDRHYTRKEVAQLCDVDQKTLERWIRNGKFPRGIRISPRSEPLWYGKDLAIWFYIVDRLTLADDDDSEEEN